MSELVHIAEGVVAQANPGEQLEAFVAQGTSTEVKAYNGEVESFTSAQSAGVGIRVIVDHRVGIAHAGSLDPEVIVETLAEARNNAEFAEPDEWMELAEPDGGIPIEHDQWDESVASTPTADKVQMAIDLEARTIGADDRISGIRTSVYSDSSSEYALASTTGISVSERGTGAHVSVLALATDNDETKVGSGYDVQFGPASLDLDVAVTDAVRRATQLLGATQPASSRLTIVLEPRMAASIVGIVVGMLNGERVIKGRSPFADRIGDGIASSVLSLTDDPTDSRSFGATSVDGEGQTCSPTPLLKEGELMGFLQNTYTGRRSGFGTTANATRGYASSPGVGPHAVIMAPGESTMEELIASIRHGVLVTSMSGLHSGVNPVSGDFSVGVEGLAIRDGQRAEPLREATIASTMQKLLGDISAVGSELEWLPGGTGAAALMVSDVSLSGA